MKLRKPIISTAKGLKRNMDLGLNSVDVEIRWDAMCKFVDNAAKYGVDPIVGYDLKKAIKSIREQQRPLPTEYLVTAHKGIDDKKVKLTFNKRDILFELETYTDFNVHQTHQNLEAKFFFDNAQSLTKVSYQNIAESYGSISGKKWTDRVKKVINLQQKQINQESATEMTK